MEGPSMDDAVILTPEQSACLRYESEDEQVYFLSGRDGTRLQVPKNRKDAEFVREPSSAAFSPAYRLLVAAFLGLAPAGLGTLVFAPLAMLWTIVIVLRFPLIRADRIRFAVVWLVAAVLLALAVPLSLHFADRLG